MQVPRLKGQSTVTLIREQSTVTLIKEQSTVTLIKGQSTVTLSILQMLQETAGRVPMHSLTEAGRFSLLEDKLVLVSNILGEEYHKDLGVYHPAFLHFITHYPAQE